MNIQIKKLLLIILMSVSLPANGMMVFLVFQDIEIANQKEQNLQANLKVLNFRNLFTENVLLADREIDFDTRLKMETAVRDLQDPEILTQWKIFTETESREDANTQAKKLLRILINKTSFIEPNNE